MNSLPSHEDTSDFFKAKRDQYVLEIRKNKSSSVISQKRIKLQEGLKKNQNTRSNSEYQQEFTALVNDLQNFQNDWENTAITLEKLRLSFSDSDHVPVSALEATGVVPYLCQLLNPEFHQSIAILNECLWILTNVASGDSESVKTLVSLNVINLALDLLKLKNYTVSENVLWLLSNIATESVEYRDLLLNNQDLPQYLEVEEIMKQDPLPKEATHFLRQVSHLILSLCKGDPAPEFFYITNFLGTIVHFVKKSADVETLKTTLWAVSFLAYGDNSVIDSLLDLGIVERIIKLLRSDDPILVEPSLKIIARLMSGEDERQVEDIISQDGIHALIKLVDHPSKSFQKDACWAISNMLCTTEKIIQQFMNYKEGEALKKLFDVFYKVDKEVSQEILHCFKNITCYGNWEQIDTLISYKVQEAIVAGLKGSDELETLEVCMETMMNILDAAEEHLGLEKEEKNPYSDLFIQSDVQQPLEALIQSKDSKISKMAVEALDDYLFKGNQNNCLA